MGNIMAIIIAILVTFIMVVLNVLAKTIKENQFLRFQNQNLKKIKDVKKTN